MKFLGIDQATTTGWAVSDETGTVLASGTWCCADRNRTGESRGMRYVRFRHELKARIDEWNPDIIVHEQTLLRGGAATELANGFKAVILEEAVLHGIEVSCVHTSELKHFATGNGRAEKKDMVESAERRLGCSVIDDNEADAVLISLWASSKFGAFPALQWPSDKKAPKRKKRSGAEGSKDPLESFTKLLSSNPPSRAPRSKGARR